VQFDDEVSDIGSQQGLGTGGCTGTKCTPGKSDGSAGKAIDKWVSDHPALVLNVVVAVVSLALGESVEATPKTSEAPAVEPATPATVTPQPESPSVHPSEIIGKTPAEIHDTATGKGLIP